MASVSLDKEAFVRRAKRLYAFWKVRLTTDQSEDGFKITDAIVSALGATDDTSYSKNTALQTWLFGYELLDTVIVMAENWIEILASKKKIAFLKPLETLGKDSNLPEVRLFTREKGDTAKDVEVFHKLIVSIKASRRGSTIGTFVKDKARGEFIKAWATALEEAKISKTDISSDVGLLLAVKEDLELSIMRRSAQITVDVFTKFLRDTIMSVVDAEKKMKHNKLAESTEQALQNKKFVSDPKNVEVCYPPIIQSGGHYNLKFSILSDGNQLHFGAIVCCLGIRYKSYCSNIVRTLMVNPPDKMQKNYDFLVQLEEYLLEQLKDGKRMCDVYEAVIAEATKQRPDLVKNLTKTFGFATGVEFRESGLLIGPKTTEVAKKDMVFVVAIGLQDLTNPDAGDDANAKTYALFIGDTVIVNENQPAGIFTNSKKKLKNVGIFVQDGEEEDDDSNKENNEAESELLGRGKRNAILEKKFREPGQEEKRREHQKELAQKVNEEARARLASQKGQKSTDKSRKASVSYKNSNQVPQEPDIHRLKIFVDHKYETVILPIYGVPVPFHISMIKNTSETVEGEYTYLRINFFHPGSAMGRQEGGFPNPEATFLKEITYRALNIKDQDGTSPSSNLNTAFRLIKDVQKKFKTREAEEKEKENLVEQDTLLVSHNKANPKLKDLFIRPNIVAKRMTGSLEAHANGFRYTSGRGDKVDILYNNIKHAFFQPGEGESIILLHFHMKNAIMFGKKKHLDVQFYTEVGELTTDLGKNQHMHDRDDLASEQAERELRHKLKNAFKTFCDKVEALTKNNVEFDVPFRALGFHGCPFRSTCLLQPTSGCLVNLTEWPPFVVSLEDVEIVHFERVQFHLKNFDMVFVFKDYHRKVVTINAIPMQMLDHVKEWLNSCDIRYSEGIQSLNWSKIMKTITEDPEAFFEEGGWSFLDPEDENEDMGSDEESGKDWSDLEREAAEDDRHRRDFEDEYSKGKPGAPKRGPRDHSPPSPKKKKSDRDDRRSDKKRPSSSKSSKHDSPSKKSSSSMKKSSSSKHHSSSSSSKHSSPSKHSSSKKRPHSGSDDRQSKKRR
ncbi:unnamed protein product [Notodromas monacha]|uniref:FACT complex subunit n=1 Tax=Notodromas monacha TaxID=399045 RepID=A0A7R9BRU1_9CRUS|nr:unnamed protein product [Notodromas monacha]CAG0919160.1 unnamed protein product [Notodromas monacha]